MKPQDLEHLAMYIGMMTILREKFATYCVNNKEKGTDPYIFVEKFDEFVSEEGVRVTRKL